MKTKFPYMQAVATAVAVLITATACGGTSGAGSTNAASNCQAKYEFPTIEKGKLTIVTYDGPPYYTGTGPTAEGIDKDILDQFAKDSCLEPVWKVMPGASVIESVRQGRADIAGGGWYANEERGKVVDQTDPIYVELPTLVAKEKVSNINDLKGRTLGVVTGDNWVDEAKTIFGDNVKLYPGNEALLDDIKAGRLDAGLTGGFVSPYLIKKKNLDLVATLMDPDPAIKASTTATNPNYPHTKGNQKLTDALNAEIKTLHDNGFIADTLEKFGIDRERANVEALKK